MVLSRRPGLALALDMDPIGSTWTMCSQDWTIALMRDVLPAPGRCSRQCPSAMRGGEAAVGASVPESPATSTFSLPILFPSSVNGLRLGILMLGMMSCGALPLSIMSDECSRWTPPATLKALLPTPSESDPSNELRLEEELLSADAGPDVPRKMGVIGCEVGGRGWLAGVPSGLFGGVIGLDSSSRATVSVSATRSVGRPGFSAFSAGAATVLESDLPG